MVRTFRFYDGQRLCTTIQCGLHSKNRVCGKLCGRPGKNGIWQQSPPLLGPTSRLSWKSAAFLVSGPVCGSIWGPSAWWNMTLCRSSRKPRAVWLRISSGWRYCHEYLSGIRSEIAETSSKGNQEKWYDAGTNSWYKLDQFGYEALAETVISNFWSGARSSTTLRSPSFLRYRMETLRVHGQERTGCVSSNFLKEGHSIITLNHLPTAAEIREVLSPALEFYPVRDRGTITDRVTACILLRERT